MAKVKPNITKTMGPIHFEDLDPHRFEDLVRELIYDFKDWQSIEATGRSGSDDGFDIRAFEKVTTVVTSENEEGEPIEERHPMEGNRWMIQGKREKEIGPADLKNILKDVNPTDPPYGYILAASANFSKKSYDYFREELRKKGVMEFFLWGKAELEDMLHLPKNDRILFTFFGVSLVSRLRSKATEIRSSAAVKNKLFNLLGEGPTLYKHVLIRELNDTKYPYESSYPDFKGFPRWKEYAVIENHPLGLIVKKNTFFSYIDPVKKEWDATRYVDLATPTEMDQSDREEHSEKFDRVEAFWKTLRKKHQGHISEIGLLRYADIVFVDPKGNAWHDFPHLYVDYELREEPFSGGYIKLEGGMEYRLDDTWKRVDIFPKTFPKPKKLKAKKGKPIEFNEETLKSFKQSTERVPALYSVDTTYDNLKASDVIEIANTKDERNSDSSFLQITTRYETTLGEYLQNQPDYHWAVQSLKEQLGIDPAEAKEDTKIKVLEFKRIWQWQLGK